MYRNIIFIFFSTLLLFACSKRSGTTADTDGKAIVMRYSNLLTMRSCDGFTVAEIRNPWDSTAVLHRYILVPSDEKLPSKLPKGDVVRVPLSNCAVYSSVHCGLMDELGAADAIKGVCDLEYIYLPKVKEGVRKGHITDLGSSMTPDIEKIIAMHPDAIFISPFENSGSYGKLGKLHIPIIECADYMETNPLGRAEWIRFYGMLLGRTHEADSIFAVVENNYNAIKAAAQKQKTRPTVVTEMKTGSTWYVAGGYSTVGILINDAGGDYIFKDVQENGAVPYSPEKVFDKAQKADFWLVKYNQATDMTMEELAGEWASYKYMKAFKNKRVYGCNLSNTRFYEDTPFHPDIQLQEYTNILHGTTADSLNYYKRLK